MTDIRRAGPLLVGLAVAAGCAAGAWRGLHWWGDGFPLLLANEVLRAAGWAALAAAGFCAVYTLLRRASLRLVPGGRLAGPLGVAAATALAGAPILAVAGYQANRAWGIRPTELATAYALQHNLGLVALGLGVGLVVVLLLSRYRRDAPEVEAGGLRRWRGGAILLVLLLAAFVGLQAAFRVPAAGAPRTPILVLLVDALRADRLGCYGGRRPTSPAIDALAKDGVLFRQAVTASTFTKSSVASIFTGRYPFQHGVYWGSSRETPEVPGEAITSDLLPDSETTVAEVLARHGYLTNAWVQNSHLRGFMGFDQGFLDYRDQQGPIPRINRLFGRFLSGPGRRYGFFTYLHYIDLHDPYRPRPPYDAMFRPAVDAAGGQEADAYAGVDFASWGRFLGELREGKRTLSEAQVRQLEALYDGQIRFVDDEIGKLLARLKRLGLYDKSLIVLLADHGDGFLEHGFISHSTTPYDELARVPLIIKLPRGEHAGRVIAEQVRLVDLVPTLLEAVGLRERLEVAGCSLMPLLDSASRSPRPAACGEAVIEIAEEGAAPIVAVRTGRYKLIVHEKRPAELYDLAADPGEKVNLAAAPPSGSERLFTVADLVQKARAARQSNPTIRLDEQQIRELKALGYID